MAMEIRPIPVVTGEDAKRFLEAAEHSERNPRTVESKMTQQEFERMMAKAVLY